MCKKLNAMGFACANTGNGTEQIARLAENATRRLSCAKGEYRCWTSPGGAELWFHYPLASGGGERSGRERTDKDGRVDQALGVTPFHRGSSNLLIRVERAVVPDKLNPLAGNIRATFRSPAAPGRHPQLRLEMVPFALQRRSRRPFTAFAQIVGFAHDVLAFETADDYLAGIPQTRLIAPGAMAAVRSSEIDGLKLDCDDSDATLAIVAGTVERAVRLVNPVSRAPYYWLVLKTDTGLIDIVTSPDSVRGDISQGHIAQVCAFFVGRLLGTPTK